MVISVLPRILHHAPVRGIVPLAQHADTACSYSSLMICKGTPMNYRFKNPLRLGALLGMLAFLGSTLHAQDWKPVEGGMMTSWGKSLKVADAWDEYPRPQFVREQWTNLNGLWDYAIAGAQSERPESWAGKILVPFCPESALSGVGKMIEPSDSLWYRRALPSAAKGKRTLLHFEAVDYEVTVWVNGKRVGSHQGGHTPFDFDITDFLQDQGNELVLKVLDATEGYQLHGKQNINPKGIWYTRVTGIWQTVWLEQVSPLHLTDVDYACQYDTGKLEITPKLSQEQPGAQVRARVSFGNQEVATVTGGKTLAVTIANPKLWTPETPHLYDVQLEVLNADGVVVDSVKAYTAIRNYGKTRDAQGHLRFTLNGKTYFHWGPLDQGWWPDGLLTPPSDEAMLSDIEFLKAAGFNMIRKHIKVEPRRYYYHCDRLGMLMWQDQVSNGTGKQPNKPSTSPKWTRLVPNPEDATWPDAAHEQFVVEYRRMVDHLRDVPCIASWVPFNEAWGQHRTMEVGKIAVEYDRTRAINIASGGNFWPVGDVADEHAYPDPKFPLDDNRFKDFVKVAGEFGGHGWPVEGHLWKQTEKNWGYGGLPKTHDEWKDRYKKSLQILNDLRKNGVAGGVYTQTTDVEVEINGLRTYDRLDKVDPAWLKEQAAILFRD